MAAVAAAIAIDQFAFPRPWVRLAYINDPSDHVFCLLSVNAPAWARASDMIGALGASGAWVIDPWLNTACEAEGYWGAAQAKVSKWARDGKRIWWQGVYGNSPGWYRPDASCAAAFGTVDIAYEAA